ncbi:MAG: SufD family Fe-S cluster assembly protein [Candidatus Peribacteraceae bacterium]|nr:SufD family Fe-S cluster assembly protein [Candidatus Peribacteraceae bacterium]MDD5741893.1 SufD family Fe-S cluster assembly protein [Candidatus Peribacteraceae bacterium]
MKTPESSHGGRTVTLKNDPKNVRIFTLSDRAPSLLLRVRRGEKALVTVECSARTKNARRSMKVELESKSTLNLVFVWRGKTSAAITQEFHVGAGARLHLANISLGSCRHDVVSEVAGARGESRIDWIVHGSGTMECRITARNIFQNKNGSGDLTMRGVAEGNAKIVCNGSVEIGPKATGTKAHLIEKILLLDPTARADATPSLDVKTHDVEAGHSASVSRIHPEDLFYFASRGVSGKKARKLFVEGFLGSGIEEIEDEGLKGMTQELLSH